MWCCGFAGEILGLVAGREKGGSVCSDNLSGKFRTCVVQLPKMSRQLNNRPCSTPDSTFSTTEEVKDASFEDSSRRTKKNKVWLSVHVLQPHRKM